MKYFYGLLLLVLFSPLCAAGQSNYQKGFVVTLTGDTLHGFINFQELGGKEPRSLAFKTHETNQDHQEFTPATTRYAEITGLAAYQSFRGRISMDVTSLPKLAGHIDTTTQAANIYLKVIQKGKNVNLFSYTDELKPRFFLQKQDGRIQELGFKKYYYNQSNNIRTLKSYTGQLWLTAVELQLGTPALQKKIELAQYRSEDLVGIVNHLNQLDQQEQRQQIEQQRNIRFFAGLGIHRATFTVEGKDNLAIDPDNKASYLPKASLGMDVFLNQHIQRFFFRGEILLHLAAADISSQHQEGQIDRAFNQSFLQPTLSVAPQLVYSFYNRENLKLNLGIGGSVNFSTYINNIYHTHTTSRSDGTKLSDTRIKGHYQFSTSWFTFPVRLGLMLNQKTDISILYFIPSYITQHNRYYFSRSSMDVGFNFLFNRK